MLPLPRLTRSFWIVAALAAPCATLLACAVALGQATDQERVQAVVAEKVVTSPQAPELPPAPSTLALPCDQHPWGRFQVGAWRSLRTITESFGEGGELITRSETLHTDTLVELTDESYTLETTSVVTVGGKRLRGAAQVTTYSLLTDHTAKAPTTTELPAVDISLSGKTVPCQQWELGYGEGPQRRIETLYYAPDFAPYILRREVFVSDGGAPGEFAGETSSVLAVDVPLLLEEGLVAGYRRQVRVNSGPNRVDRTELLCDQTPGGLVQAASTERDASGRRVRWVVTELDDYGVAAAQPAPERRLRLFPNRGR